MGKINLPAEALCAAEAIGHADVVIGIPSYNNARTVAHVVRAAYAGLAKYFPDQRAVVINSDGGSTDGTREAVLSARVEDCHLLLLDTPAAPAQSLSLPYHGIAGKGSAFRLIFELAQRLGARGCCVVDSDLRSITPEWIELLLGPVMGAGFDFVAPYYHRHKYDGTITNSIVYPLTRMLYGSSVRQPIGGDFGMSGRVISRYLERGSWESDVARFGIDIWMTTVAIAEGFRVCQSFLGAKLHDAKDPGSDLTTMLEQVVGSVFGLMMDYENVWWPETGARTAQLFGFRYDVGLDPIAVNVDRMAAAFRRGCQDLRAVWRIALSDESLEALDRVAGAKVNGSPFHLDDALWARVVLEFACAYKDHPLERTHLLRSLPPLYLGRVASFVGECENLDPPQVESKVEALCQQFERLKPYLAARWRRQVGFREVVEATSNA